MNEFTHSKHKFTYTYLLYLCVFRKPNLKTNIRRGKKGILACVCNIITLLEDIACNSQSFFV